MTNKDREESLTVEEGDQLIREFMDHGYMAIRLQYHASWDELMPVVEKIEGLGHKTIIGGGDQWGHYMNIMYSTDKERLQFGDDTKALGQGETKIEAVYNAVIEFIGWYNTQNKNPLP